MFNISFHIGLKKFSNKFFSELTDNFNLNLDLTFFELKNNLKNVKLFFNFILLNNLYINNLNNIKLKLKLLFLKNNDNYLKNLILNDNKKINFFFQYEIIKKFYFKPIKFSSKRYGFLNINSKYFFIVLPFFVWKRYKWYTITNSVLYGWRSKFKKSIYLFTFNNLILLKKIIIFNKSRKYLKFFNNFKKRIRYLRFNLFLFLKNFFLLSFKFIKKNLLNFFYSLNLFFFELKFNLKKYFGTLLTLNDLKNKNLILNNDKFLFLNDLKNKNLSFSIFNIFNISLNNNFFFHNKLYIYNFFNYLKGVKFIRKKTCLNHIRKILKMWIFFKYLHLFFKKLNKYFLKNIKYLKRRHKRFLLFLNNLFISRQFIMFKWFCFLKIVKTKLFNSFLIVLKRIIKKKFKNSFLKKFINDYVKNDKYFTIYIDEIFLNFLIRIKKIIIWFILIKIYYYKNI